MLKGRSATRKSPATRFATAARAAKPSVTVKIPAAPIKKVNLKPIWFNARNHSSPRKK